MRIFILFCFFLINTSIFYSQTTFNRAYHVGDETSNPFLVEINNHFYFTSIVNGIAGYDHFLYSYSATGNLNFRQMLLLSSEPLVGFKSLDNKLVLAGGDSWHCDIQANKQVNYLAKYNSNGTAVFQTTYNVGFGNKPVACVQAADSNYYTFTDSSLIKIDKSGQFNFKINSGFSKVASAILLPNNQILLSAMVGSISSLAVVTLSGTVVNFVTTPTLCSTLAFYGNQNIIGNGLDGKFYKFTPSLNLIATSTLLNNQSVNGFASLNDSLYCILTSSTNPTSYGVCDTLFNFFINNTTTTERITQKAIMVTSGTKTAILSDGIAHNTPFYFSHSKHHFVNLNVINKNASNNFYPDVALISLEVDSSYAVCPNGPLGINPPCTVYLKAKVNVKNVGTQNIHSFKINCFENMGIACGHRFYEETFSQLNLRPGDSITVKTSNYVPKYYVSATSSITQVSFCFYVSVPNDEVDKTLQDNELCKSFNFVTVGLGDIKKSEFDLKLYPNPFNSELKIESSELIFNYKLLDVLGKLLQEGNVETKTLNIKTENLKQGIYFLSVETKNGLVTKKIVKE